MNNNMIKNNAVEVNEGINLNEKDYLTSLLSILKDMTKNYAIVLTESSNETLYEKIKEDFANIVEMEREVFETMFKNGWYILEKEEQNKIMNKYNLLTEELNNIL